ncbi:MAG TPA: 4'-phosphopantetheinyl transferase superfamily protein [Polyangiaceae bacterium]|nr:4'-phosphopantetheinyl transferase superfamily protein [Polyangiaceae bacterium]
MSIPMISPFPRSDGPLAQLLDSAAVAIAEIDPQLVTPGAGLYPEEAASVAQAVESRRKQFTAGRVLARDAWQRLGVPAQPLLSDEQRVPRWPAGIVGTITHTHGWCAAAVARDTELAALGADVEAATPLERGLWERICRPAERRVLVSSPERGGVLGKAFFSAKESIYKALYPSVRVFLDFQSMQIELEPLAEGRYRWQAELQIDWGRFKRGQRFGPGVLGIDERWILSAIALPPGALSAG